MRGYTFVDYATQGYVGLTALLILLFHGHTVPNWAWLAGTHLLVIAGIHFLIRWHLREPSFKPLDLIRHFYPVLLYAGMYAETGWLNQMFITGYLDATIIHCDQWLFGCQPSLVLMEKWPLLPVSELFYAAYFSYYIMIGGVGLALYLKNRVAFFHYVSVVSFVFYICYLIYITVPVIGPPVFFETVYGYHLPAALQGLVPPEGFPASVQSGAFFKIMKWIYQVFESPGAAIPSSHVAIAWCTVWFSFQYLRAIRWVHAVAALLLCIATVYCRYHYGTDVLAGIVTALVLIPMGNWLYARFGPSIEKDPHLKELPAARL